MKNSTKYKIIQWVTKILKYSPPIHLPTKEETRKIIPIKVSAILYTWDATHEYQRLMAADIAKELLRNNLIKISKEDISDRPNHFDPGTLFTAELNVVEN